MSSITSFQEKIIKLQKSSNKFGQLFKYTFIGSILFVLLMAILEGAGIIPKLKES